MTTSQRIVRSRTDRLISGVCGGLARYFALDSVIVRGVLVVLGLLSPGIVAIAYLVAITLFPEESETGAATQSHPGWRFDPWTGERISPVSSETSTPPVPTTPPTTNLSEDDTH